MNSTALPDEMLAHRLGLIPLKCTNFFKEYTFELNVTGPMNVLSDHLHIDSSEDIEVVKGILLFVLKEGQSITLRCFTDTGNGKSHARFMAATGISYCKRHQGVEYPECHCIADYDTVCAKCGKRKPSKDVCARPFVYDFHFGTTGSLTPEYILAKSLSTLHKSFMGIYTGHYKREPVLGEGDIKLS